ncbi:MAG: beta-ketoacyl synthase [Bacteroidetes bacterium]|nr:beta-ketoacyl synthase [Bacteroidota bacterium]MBS1628606.1 beta-ketoacyl synthase [Bacteroidota bacterium]
MAPVFCIASNICSPMGLSTHEVWSHLQQGKTGLRQIEDEFLFPRPITASAFQEAQWPAIEEDLDKHLSAFEKLCVFSIREAMSRCEGLEAGRCLFILSSTKGNIEWLDAVPDERLRLSSSASLIAQACGLPKVHAVISQACISGVAALIYAFRRLQQGAYDTAIICGADRLTPFVLAGFSSFQALAQGPCKPFDVLRDGINLGEAAATIVLSRKAGAMPLALMTGGASSNDANHISGPSRNGEELALAIRMALNESGIQSDRIGAISAHGTATLYNDEMESKAFALTGLLHAPLHSIKGYLGHTLGAAGMVESALLIESLRRGMTIPSAGYEHLGVSQPVTVSTTSEQTDIRYALKTASGFGGCNAAAVFAKA